MTTQTNNITKQDLNNALKPIQRGQAFVYWSVGVLALALVAFVVLIITLIFLGYIELNDINEAVGSNTANIYALQK